MSQNTHQAKIIYSYFTIICLIVVSMLFTACSWAWWSEQSQDQSKQDTPEINSDQTDQENNLAYIQAGMLATASDQNKNLLGFEYPQAVVYSPHHQQYFVSNLGLSAFSILPQPESSPLEKEKTTGFISRLTNDAEVDILEFIVGLKSPQSMACSQNFLYVADQNNIKAFDIITGSRKWEIDLSQYGIENIQCLVLVDEILYISVPKNSQILALDIPTRSVKIWAEIKDLHGLAWNTFSSTFIVISGKQLLELDRQGKVLQTLQTTEEQAEYLSYDQSGNLYLAYIESGFVVKQDKYKIIHTVADKLDSCGQFGLGKNVTLIPCTTKHYVRRIRLP